MNELKIYKICTGCHELKPLSEFYKQKLGKYGKKSKCKSCAKEQKRIWAESNRDRINKGNRRRYLQNIESEREHRRAYRLSDKRIDITRNMVIQYAKNNPEKARAGSAIHNELRSGRMVKPSVCEHCGNEPEKTHILQGHHSDYTKPLEVVWLCPRCHAIEHRRLRAEAKAMKIGGLV